MELKSSVRFKTDYFIQLGCNFLSSSLMRRQNSYIENYKECDNYCSVDVYMYQFLGNIEKLHRMSDNWTFIVNQILPEEPQEEETVRQKPHVQR